MIMHCSIQTDGILDLATNLVMISMREKNFWSLKSIKKTVGETMELLEKARDKVASIFSLKQGNEPKRKSQMRLQNRHKSEKRIRLRYKENEEAIQRKILQIQEDTELTLDKDFVIDHDILITDAIATLKVHEMCYLSSISNNIPSTTQAVQTIRASLSEPCFRKLVWIDASVPCETNPWR